MAHTTTLVTVRSLKEHSNEIPTTAHIPRFALETTKKSIHLSRKEVGSVSSLGFSNFEILNLEISEMLVHAFSLLHMEVL